MGKYLTNIPVLMCVLLYISCAAPVAHNLFKDDLKFLENKINPVVLKKDNQQLIVSPELQGRILVSTSNGLKGQSYGWFNRKLISSDSLFQNISKAGGASRIWFGPDFGENDVFAELDTATNTITKKAPKALDNQSFNVIEQSNTSITVCGSMHIENIKNFDFYIDVHRKITLLTSENITSYLDITLDKNIDFVAFRAETKMTNIGNEDWDKAKGLISLWELGCMQPTPKTTVVIPLKGNVEEATVYFTPLDSTRIKIQDNILFYRADANYLNKIGTLPKHTLPYFGSYSPELNLLTIVRFRFTGVGDYVNAHPQGKNPYGGDVINVFNDGEWDDGGPFGPFYELETSSPAKALKVGESVSHYHETYHFEGSEEELNQIALEVFGVSISKIKSALH